MPYNIPGGAFDVTVTMVYVTNDMHHNLFGRTLRSAAARLLCSLFARHFVAAKGEGPQTRFSLLHESAIIY